MTTTVPDHLDTLRAASRRVAKADSELRAARAERDEQIRVARRTTGHTVAEIAKAAGISHALARSILHGVAKGEEA